MVTPFVLAKDVGLTQAIHITSTTPLPKILKRKRSAAKRACKNFPEAESVFVYGSVALGDILGFFSDIDMFFLGNFKEKRNFLLKVADEPIVATFHTFESFRTYLKREVRYYNFDERSSLYYCLLHPLILKGKNSFRPYQKLVNTEIDNFFSYYNSKELLNNFYWYYGAGLEATLRGDTYTGFLKIQEAAKVLLRFWLLKNKTLLRKPLPDRRGLSYLKTIRTPESLLTFCAEAFKRKDTSFTQAKKAFSEVAGSQLWYGSITL